MNAKYVYFALFQIDTLVVHNISTMKLFYWLGSKLEIYSKYIPYSN